MENVEKKINNSRAPIVGLFATILLMLTFPLVIFISQQQQDIRQKASTLQPTISQTNTNSHNYISGYIYLDDNTDGERQYGEKGIDNAQLKITQGNLITFIDSDQNGYFKYIFSNEDSTPTLTVELILPKGHKTINTNPNTLNIQNDTKNILEFGIYPIIIK